MDYTFYELVWFFLIYSFAGWCAEVCAAAVQKRKFVNRGFVAAPVCPIYGTGAVLFAVFLTELKGHLLVLFVFGGLLASLVEFFTGALLEKIFHRKWWDYSNEKFNFDGYTCLKFSAIWGAFAILLVYFVNPFLKDVIGLMPDPIRVILAWVALGILAADVLGTTLAIRGMQKKLQPVSDLTENIKAVSKLLENSITRHIQRRMERAFPNLEPEKIAGKAVAGKEKSGVFAEGCSFYKLVYLFFLGAFLGDITETIFCLITAKKLMSRSSVVYGPFSIVWGLGCMLLTWILYRYKDKSDSYMFVAGTLLGGIFEYICSVFTELVFGTIFWDYNGFAFNLGGRINLLFCFFWGIAAVVWFRIVYPFLSGMIEKIPEKIGKLLAWVLIVFMVWNVAVSSLALIRYTQRNTKTFEEAEIQYQELNQFLDSHFPDERMERIYPNAKIVENMK
ncbi:MAG: putative ABC transporter permease [Candidatus Limivivens sp.]|nr:putative ABC transporter permease [Candidatus Limivivens sp.]